MPRGKKNSTTTSTTTKTSSKTVAEPIKEKAVAPETQSTKPTVKKKAAAPKKATTPKASTTQKTATSVTTVETGVLKSAVVENTEKETKKSTAKTTKKAAPKTTKKTTTNTAKKTSAVAAKSKKSAAKKTAKGKSDEILIQSSGKDYTLADITETCKNAYRGGTRKQIKSIKVYVKAEGNQLKAYYVVNDNISGSVNL